METLGVFPEDEKVAGALMASQYIWHEDVSDASESEKPKPDKNIIVVVGAYLCSPVPMFPGAHVPRYRVPRFLYFNSGH